MLPAFAIALTIATVLAVYDPTKLGLDATNGLYVLWVSVPLGLLIVYRMTAAKPGRWDEALATFARFERDVVDDDETGAKDSYRTPPKKVPGKATLETKLKKVTALPADLAGILEQGGDGKPVAFFEIHPRIAYVAITEADTMNASDCTTVVMKLEDAAPSFEARPLLPLDPQPPDLVGFAKDKSFSERYVVVGSDAKRVRSFLSEPIRSELCDLPSTWVEADGKALAVSAYGDFEPARALRLMEAADVFFAEYGAGGGPSLLEPSGMQKKKKRKKKPDAPAGDPEESPA